MGAAMKNGGDNGSSDTEDRYGDSMSPESLASFRSSVRREVLAGDFEGEHHRRNGSMPGLDGLPGVPPPSVLDVPPPHIPASSLTDVGRVAELGRVSEMGHVPHLDESVFDPPSWLDNPTMPLADHPLLRGLLLELPNKGPMPSAEWLDRWFEAARSILELLYAQTTR
jgi:hypothetical protein